MAPKNFDSRCKARAKSGKPCRAAATEGGLCFFHANPQKASELGRIGGRSNGRAGAESADPLPILDNAIAVRETGARLIADVYAGKLQPKVAASLAPLLNLQLRAIETADLEQRVAKIETLLAETRHSEEQRAADTTNAGLAAKIASGRARVVAGELQERFNQNSPKPVAEKATEAYGLADSLELTEK
jgi:hypothetical protein